MPRYQTHVYAYETVTVPPFIDGDEPTTVTRRMQMPGAILDAAPDRGVALKWGRAMYGADFAGIVALDVDCTFCEDSGAVGNAARWTDANAPETAACPRCGVSR